MGIESRMKAETCPAVQGMYKRLRTKTYNNPYKSVAEFMTDETLKEIGGSVMGEEILLWASHKLAQNSRYLFWEHLLMNRQCFSDVFVAAIWLEIFTDCGNRSHQHPVEADGIESDFSDFSKDEVDLGRLRQSVITSPLLLDSPAVLRRYCQAQKTGWETLRYLRAGGRQWQTLHNWAGVRGSINEDDVPGFAMGRVMLGSSLSFSIIAEILNNGALKIFRYLLENNLENLEAVVPLGELACYIVSQFPDNYSIPVLEMLEEARPGLVASFTDALGQNLLWYGMHNPMTCWFHPNCKLTEFLLEHGCSPDAATRIGLSWRFLKDSLSSEMKDLLWRRVFCVYNYHDSQFYEQMREVQPNLWS